MSFATRPGACEGRAEPEFAASGRRRRVKPIQALIVSSQSIRNRCSAPRVFSGFITVFKKLCVVPDFANVKRDDAQQRWADAGFTTQVIKQASTGSPANYKIGYQSITGGTIDPQPNGCDSTITVGP